MVVYSYNIMRIKVSVDEMLHAWYYIYIPIMRNIWLFHTSAPIIIVKIETKQLLCGMTARSWKINLILNIYNGTD